MPAIWLLAPGLVSTITVCPSAAPSGGAMLRAMMSVAPPGTNPTIMRIGLLGNC